MLQRICSSNRWVTSDIFCSYFIVFFFFRVLLSGLARANHLRPSLPPPKWLHVLFHNTSSLLFLQASFLPLPTSASSTQNGLIQRFTCFICCRFHAALTQPYVTVLLFKQTKKQGRGCFVLFFVIICVKCFDWCLQCSSESPPHCSDSSFYQLFSCQWPTWPIH